jgi:hypothetical protein
MEKEFIKFLKDNKIYYKFRYRLKKDNCMTISEFFRRYPFPENYFLFAFMWSDKECDFWNAMDDKWRKIVRKSKSTNIIRRLINKIFKKK